MGLCKIEPENGLASFFPLLGLSIQKICFETVLLLTFFVAKETCQAQEMFFDERYSFTKMKNPDFVAIAKAYGIDGCEVSERENLDAAIADMLKDDEPYLLVVNVEMKGMVYPMIPAGGSVTNILLGE